MVVYKKKKCRKLRGSKTHGWGAKKKHRGAGNRGGRGMAGSGKRGDAKKPSIWSKKYFGKQGFVKHGIKRDIKAVNIQYIEENFDELLSDKIIENKNGSYIIDIDALGFNKLVGKGNPTKKYIISCEFASKKAIDKIEQAGGKINLKEFAKESSLKDELNQEKELAKPA